MIGTRIAASIVIVMMSIFALSCCCECVFYQIRRSVSTLPVKVNRFMHAQRWVEWSDVVRPSLVIHNPPGDLSEPRSLLAVLIREGDTGVPVVHLFTAETLVSRYE